MPNPASRSSEHFTSAAEPLRFEHHSGEPRIDRQAGESAAQLRESTHRALAGVLLRDERTELVEQGDDARVHPLAELVEEGYDVSATYTPIEVTLTEGGQ